MNTTFNKKYKGMTLVELIVAMGVMVIVVGGLSTLFYVGWTSQEYQLELGEATVFADRGVSSAIKEVRQAQQGADGSYPIKSGDDFDIVFYSDVDADDTIERLHYYLDSGVFKRGITDPVGNPLVYPVSDDSTAVVTVNTVNTGSDPIFTYYDGTGATLTTPITPSLVRMIKITLLVDVDPFSSPIPVTVESISTMRNLVNN